MSFFLLLKQSFQCLSEYRHGSPKHRCLIRAVRGTGNFVWQQATLVQGCTSEAQLNMDVNLCRLPGKRKSMPKFPVPLAGIMWHLFSTDSAAILTKQPERQFTSKKNTHSKNCWHFTSKKISCTWKASKFFAQNLSQSLIHNCLEYLWKK